MGWIDPAQDRALVNTVYNVAKLFSSYRIGGYSRRAHLQVAG
jgi:hypothetical protein